MEVNEKLRLLREKMREAGVDAYYIPTADPHMSEYIAPCYQGRAWISGFSGSAGQVLVDKDKAKLWTDGRYFIQAAGQLAGSEFELMKQNTPGYPSLFEYLSESLGEGQRLGANGRLISQKEAEALQELAENKGFESSFDLELLEAIWEDRPAPPDAEIFLLEEKYSGKKTAAKLSELREFLQESKADALLLGRLDDIAWLYNFRGGDVAHTPVALAYAYVDGEKACLFIDEAKVRPEVREALAAEGIEVLGYETAEGFVSKLEGKRIQLDPAGINHRLYAAIPDSCRIIRRSNYTEEQKAVKNETEIRNQREAYRKDGLALTRMIYQLKTHPDISEWDEQDVSERLLAEREKLEHFLEQSFTTIAAYGPNAAMMHYAPTPEKKAQLDAKGFLLIDSGGQYLEGTTDTTRTIALGPLTDEEIKSYTLTLKSHIALASAVFLEGIDGYYLDALARQPLWKHHMDYKCGTGHGVGYLLSVHEGPHRIASRPNKVALVPGMIVTDEPGVYIEGAYGIRIENVYVVEEDAYVEPDRYFCFSGLTLVPMEREAIDVSLLNEDEIAWLDRYHAEVYEALAPDLSEEQKAWLRDVCRPL